MQKIRQKTRESFTRHMNPTKICFILIVQGFWLQKFSEVYVMEIPSLCGPTLVIKTYSIISGETPFYRCHLQSVQCTQRILCILMVQLFRISFLSLLDVVHQYLNLKEI